ncbi:hypothetical protein [Nonomuraea sp. SBT364]|uniref:hypothetical protein n=1 Tax=Nonomuraea sp. SBT364 TaxID=1580530 RepID=UPI00066B8C2A|nr:hypothetical protein [Nonomuraea sp. SBT364]
MSETRESAWPAVRLVILMLAGVVVGNVALALLTTRDPGLGFDELIAFGGGALLGVAVEFGILRRSRR